MKTAGATVAAISGSMAFPGILKYARGEDAIKFGVCVTLSGPASVQGEDMADASKLAAEHINAKGGLLGRKVEIVVRDDGGNPALSATRVKEMIERDKINFVAGGNISSTGHAQHQQTVPKKILNMVNCMSEDVTAVPMFSKYSFHPDVTPYMLSAVMGKFAAERWERKWYFLIADYAFGWQNYNAFSKVLKEYKGENLGISPHPIGQADFSTYIGKIIAAKPTVLITINAGMDQVNSWKQLRDFGVFDQMKVVGVIFMSCAIWSLGIEAVMGGYGGCTFYWEAPESKDFADIYWKRFNRAPSDDGMSQYESVMEICSAVQRAKSLNVDKLVKELEGHRFKWCKGEEWWRPCDHQAIQDIYVLSTKKPTRKYDTFVIEDKKGGEELAKSCEEQGHKKS